jgi:hypothetical protein
LRRTPWAPATVIVPDDAFLIIIIVPATFPGDAPTVTVPDAEAIKAALPFGVNVVFAVEVEVTWNNGPKLLVDGMGAAGERVKKNIIIAIMIIRKIIPMISHTHQFELFFETVVVTAVGGAAATDVTVCVGIVFNVGV